MAYQKKSTLKNLMITCLLSITCLVACKRKGYEKPDATDGGIDSADGGIDSADTGIDSADTGIDSNLVHSKPEINQTIENKPMSRKLNNTPKEVKAVKTTKESIKEFMSDVIRGVKSSAPKIGGRKK